MNFYKAQDQARKQTVWLLFLFTLAVTSLVLITNICVAFFVLYSNPEYALNGVNPIGFSAGNPLLWCENLISALGWKKFTWTTLLVVGVLGISMLFKWLALREGGRVVAESLGGRPVLPNTDNAKERRLLNVVEEISLAAGIPPPLVYLLEQEQGINAFAAGLSSEDAVIGITQGSLDSFNREQLQGVIAHEFSHILNGDMRLNMKLLVVLHGILMISESGRLVMRMSSRRGSRHRGKNGGAVAGIFAFGLSLWLIGSLGQFFGALIKSAVSRQREFLADASAVQFTRNPNGIGEALSLIGGASMESKVSHHSAHEMSHLFFSRIGLQRRFFSQVFATHPPLEERIKRVMPAWKGRFLKRNHDDADDGAYSDPLSSAFSSTTSSSEQINSQVTGQSERVAADVLSPIEFVPTSLDDGELKPVMSILASKAHEPADAGDLIASLLLDSDQRIADKQLALLEAGGRKEMLEKVCLNQTLMTKVSAEERLSLVELAIPSLKHLSVSQYRAYRSVFSELIHADGKIDLLEWLIFQLLKQHCDRHFGLSRPEKPKYRTIDKVLPLYQVVLSRVVYYGSNSSEDQALAFEAGCRALGVADITLLPIEACGSGKFSRSAHQLGLAYPLLKPRILKGLIQAAQADAVVSNRQRYVIKGLAAVMDCPLASMELQ